MTGQDTTNTKNTFLANLVKLTLSHIVQIDKTLAEVGDYGEVHIIVERGQLRYINKIKSDKFDNQDESK